MLKMFKYFIVFDDYNVLGVDEITDEDKEAHEAGYITIIRLSDQTYYGNGDNWVPIKEYKRQK